MITSCKVIQDLAPLYCDRVADPETVTEIRRHLRVCPSCRKYYSDTVITVHKAPEKPAPDREQGYLRVSRRVRNQKTLTFGAAAVLCAAAVGCLVYSAVKKVQ